MAYTLAAAHNKKVLIIDNDKQGNTSKAFKKYDTEGQKHRCAHDVRKKY